jgi:hypothetical protein
MNLDLCLPYVNTIILLLGEMFYKKGEITWKVGEHSLVVSNPYQILTSFSLFPIDSVRDIPVSKSGGQQQSG